MKKNEFICPACGEAFDIECQETFYNGASMDHKMYCQKCEHTWHEHYLVEYDGYSDETGKYDKNGGKVSIYGTISNE